MKLDTVVQEFIESVDREAMGYVEELSHDPSLAVRKQTLPAFQISESFKQFTEYLEGYAQYQIKHKDNPDRSPSNMITECTERFLENPNLFQECRIPYAAIPDMIRGYIGGMQQMLEHVEHLKSDMLLEDVSPENIGAINDYADQFVEKVDAHFQPWMEQVLMISGYRRNHPKEEIQKTEPVFL